MRNAGRGTAVYRTNLEWLDDGAEEQTPRSNGECPHGVRQRDRVRRVCEPLAPGDRFDESSGCDPPENRTALESELIK